MPTYRRLFAVAIALLMSGSVALPAMASVYVGMVCCIEEVEVSVTSSMPCHDEIEEEPQEHHGSTAMICCATDAGVEATLIVPGLKELRASLVAVEHPAILVDTHPIQVIGLQFLRQNHTGIPETGLPVLYASLLI